MNKICTSIEQSKKLAEILPIESADMYWWPTSLRYYIEAIDDGDFNDKADIRAWSLAALLSILPYPSLHKTFAGWRCDSYDKEGKTCKLGENADNPIDACYKMILKLHELKML